MRLKGGALLPGVIKAATVAAGETRRRRPMTYRMSCEQLHGLTIENAGEKVCHGSGGVIPRRSA